MTTWLITGCSSGLGRALAEAVLREGHRVVATARDAETLSDLASQYPETVLAVTLDITESTHAVRAVTQGLERFGEIDVLVNNAGYGYRAAIEEGTAEDITTQFETNVHGPVRLIQAVLPAMRAQKSGTIVNISSISARFQPEGSGFYSASKAALEALTGSLRKEVEPLGIRVFTIEPGAFRTEFAGRSLQQSASAISDYADTAGKRRIENDTAHGTQPGDPAKAATAIINVVTGEATPPRMLLLGSDAVSVVSNILSTELDAINEWKHLSTSTDLDA